MLHSVLHTFFPHENNLEKIKIKIFVTFLCSDEFFTKDYDDLDSENWILIYNKQNARTGIKSCWRWSFERCGSTNTNSDFPLASSEVRR